MLQTALLPSGYPYTFPYLNLRPLQFSEILEYSSNVKDADQVEKFYADYCLLRKIDPRIDDILLCDLDYVFFCLQVETVKNDQTYHSTIDCPRCGHKVRADLALSSLRYKRLDPVLLKGLDVEIRGNKYGVRIPTIGQFMKVFANYRRFKRITDLRLIKIISLFEDAENNPQGIENLVATATNEDIKTLVALETILIDTLETYTVTCQHCVDTHEPTDVEMSLKAEELGKKVGDLTYYDIEEIKREYGGIEVSPKGLSSAVFLELLQYTDSPSSKISARVTGGVQ